MVAASSDTVAFLYNRGTFPGAYGYSVFQPAPHADAKDFKSLWWETKISLFSVSQPMRGCIVFALSW